MLRLRRSMEDYAGLHVGCAPGTHAALFEAIMSNSPVKDGVLDIGAHSGALLKRFQDKGFSNLVGVDLDETRFDVDGADFLKVDLNADFAERVGRSFSVITATDVIEHLDSPRHFLSEIHQLLRPGGILGITFPNVAFWEGRIKFLLQGELWGFGEKNYVTQRHISPMTLGQSRLMWRELGFEVTDIFSAGSFSTMLKTIAFSPLWVPMRLLGGATALGECIVIVARRSEADASLRLPDHYKTRWSGEADTIGLDT